MYRLIWKRKAVDQLTTAWTTASSAERTAIRLAVSAVEARLRRDPTNVGESRAGRRRIEIAPPVAILFTVDAVQTVVRVRRFWLPRRRRRG